MFNSGYQYNMMQLAKMADRFCISTAELSLRRRR